MPEGKSGSNLRQIGKWQKAAARDYYLRHPDQSIADVAKALNVAVRTVARAREALVKEGLLQPGRHAESVADTAVLAVANSPAIAEGTNVPEEVAAAIPAAAEAKRSSGVKNKLLDDEALLKMSEMLDELSETDDVEETRKRMLRQVQRFAFDPTLHPDTRMSASQLWAKLVDMQRAKDLGPGKPVTLADAIDRATDFCRAAGPKVMVPAFYKAFDLEDPTSVQAKNDQAPTLDPTAQATGAAGHDSDGAPLEVVRRDDVRSERTREAVQDSDHAGPPQGRPSDAGDSRTPPHLDTTSPWS